MEWRNQEGVRRSNWVKSRDDLRGEKGTDGGFVIFRL